MLSSQVRPSASTTTAHEQNDPVHQENDGAETEQFRDIHALTSPTPPLPPRARSWEIGSQRTPSMSMNSEGGSSDNFTTMSREFSALVLAGSTTGSTDNPNNNNSSNFENSLEGLNGSNNNTLLSRIREDEDVPHEETNPLAIVPDTNPMEPNPSSRRVGLGGGGDHQLSVQRVKKEEVDAKISAWQNAKVSKINNRFKRDEAIINGWESEHVQKATSWMKKVERKLEAKRARALEKMQNKIAKAHRKAEERKASAEATRGTKVARVLEVANLMRAVGRAPAKRSFF